MQFNEIYALKHEKYNMQCKSRNITSIRTTLPAEVAWQIRHLKPRKSPGPDGIQNLVLLKLPKTAIQVVTAKFQ